MKEPTGTGARGAKVSVVLGAVGLGVVTLAGAAWFLRAPILDAALRGALGIEADWVVDEVGLAHARLVNVRLGAEERPDVTAQAAAVSVRWTLLGPQLAGVRLDAPYVRASLDENGLSLGQLDKFFRPAKTEPAAPAELPAIGIVAVDGLLDLSTPAGTLSGGFASEGVLTENFEAKINLPVQDAKSDNGEWTGLSAALSAKTVNRTLETQGRIDARRARVLGLDMTDVALSLDAKTPPNVSGSNASLRGTARSLAVADAKAGNLRFDAALQPLPAGKWRLRGAAEADTLASSAAEAKGLRLTASGGGDGRAFAGEWMARAESGAAAGIEARQPGASGQFTYAAADGPGRWTAEGAVSVPEASMEPKARTRWLGVLPDLGGLPGEALMRGAKSSLGGALSNFSAEAGLTVEWSEKSGRLTLSRPLTVQGAQGARLTLSGKDQGSPALSVSLPSGDVTGAPTLRAAGDGLPPLTLALTSLTSAKGAVTAEGALALPDWRVGRDRLDAPRVFLSFNSGPDGGALSLNGLATISGGTALAVDNLMVPLRFTVGWSDDAFSAALAERCLPLTASQLEAAGHSFRSVRASLCAIGTDNALAGERDGRAFGGFAIDPLRLTGSLQGSPEQTASLDVGRLGGRWAGGAKPLRILASDLAYSAALASDRTIRFTAASLTADMSSQGEPLWSGALAGGRYEDPGLGGVDVSEVKLGWLGRNEPAGFALRFSGGGARVIDTRPANVPEAAWLPRFEPLRLTGADGALLNGAVTAAGGVDLEERSRPLLRFEARHDFDTGAGSARAWNESLVFSSGLDLFEITRLAQGVVDQVTGPADVSLSANWRGDTFATGAKVTMNAIDFNTASLGPVSDVSGTITLSDALALVSPPGQRITIGKLNPGVEISNGVIDLQVLSPERIQIEGAAWPYAGGTLTIAPQTVTLGADEFAMEVGLSGVDVSQFIASLQLKDLDATGTVEGVFPLVFTKEGGRIVNGRLKAGPSGGTIRYTGAAGEGLIGPPQIAFEALRSFRYDELELELNGDIDGEIVTAIEFTGQNQLPIAGIPVGRALPIPGAERLQVSGLPFVFRVSVRAPFRRLLESYDETRDARPLVQRTLDAQSSPDDAGSDANVDQDDPTDR